MQDAFAKRERIAEAERLDRIDSLARRVADGDRAAFELLYSETVHEMFTFVRWQCRNDAVAEDLTANVFLKAWKSARSYRQGSRSYRRWLFTIARNELVDHWRRSRETLPIDGLQLPDLAQGDGGEQEVDAESVLRALERLTPEQREVVVMRFFNDYSHAEIARQLGKREGAVRAQLLRALRQMRKAMNDAST